MKITRMIQIGATLLPIAATAMDTPSETSDQEIQATALDTLSEITIKLPEANILEKAITGVLGSPHFLEKTSLHKELANNELYPMGIQLKVQLAIYDYNSNMSSGGMPAHMARMIAVQMSRSEQNIIDAIVKSGSVI